MVFEGFIKRSCLYSQKLKLVGIELRMIQTEMSIDRGIFNGASSFNQVFSSISAILLPLFLQRSVSIENFSTIFFFLCSF